MQNTKKLIEITTSDVDVRYGRAEADHDKKKLWALFFLRGQVQHPSTSNMDCMHLGSPHEHVFPCPGAAR
jgi:hypothetical protein